jgi:RHS repeat-associated protein
MWWLSMLLWLGCALGGLAHAGTVTYVYTDPQGTPLAEADASGNITATFDYAPYGGQALGTPPSGPGYTGHVNDPESGLVYMQARYYDPTVGRFLSVDPVGPAPGNAFNFNRYGYANNDPIVNMDPDGRCTGSHISNGDGSCASTGEFTTRAQSAKSLDARQVGKVFTHSSVFQLGRDAESSAFPKETRNALHKFLGSAVGGKIGREAVRTGKKIGLELLLPTSGYPGVFATVDDVITYTLQWKQFIAANEFRYEFKGAGLDVLLAHEIGHTSIAGRTLGYRPSISNSDADEFNAVRYVENPYRGYLGIPLRTNYSGLKIPDPIISEK